jgi:two-component system sensor kinase FixL
MAFVRYHLRLGRSWLFQLACAMRVLALVVNFSVAGSLNLREVSALVSVPSWGGAMAPVGEINSWVILGQLGNAVFVVFMCDAALGGWRRSQGDARLRMLFVIGSLVAWLALVSLWSLLVFSGLLTAPLASMLPSIPVMLLIAYDMGKGVRSGVEATVQLEVARRALGEVNARLELSLEAARMGWWAWDAHRDEVSMSDTARRFLQTEAGQKIDASVLRSRLHPEDRAASDALIAGIRETGGHFSCEFRFADDHSTAYRWIATRGHLVVGEDGALQRVDGVLADVTETKRSAARFESAISGAPNAILLVDARGLIVLANPMAGRVFGYPHAGMIGMAIEALVPDCLRPLHATSRPDDPESGPRQMAAGRELLGLRKDGGEIAVEIYLSPIDSEGGPQVIASIIDVSERRRLERESSVLRDELAHLSRISLLGELSASLAHELNQPLTAILSNAQAAIRFFDRDPPDLPEIRDSLVNIVESDKRAGEVIRRLRAMLRKQPIDMVDLEINDVILGVVNIVRSDLLNREVRLVLGLRPDLPAVQGDRVQLQQVMLNLIMNASDAMDECPEGDRMLTVSTQACPDGGVEISVSDAGKGIAPPDLERIFDSFVTSKREGMGLGLTVCRSIVRAHRGRLWASNNAGPGATLRVWLPAVSD